MAANSSSSFRARGPRYGKASAGSQLPLASGHVLFFPVGFQEKLSHDFHSAGSMVVAPFFSQGTSANGCSRAGFKERSQMSRNWLSILPATDRVQTSEREVSNQSGKVARKQFEGFSEVLPGPKVVAS